MSRYIYKNGELLEYSEYVRLHGAPEKRAKSLIINKSFDAYESHASGKVISSHAQRRDDMARNNCVDYDPGVVQDYQRNIEEGEKALNKCVDDHVDKEWSTMTTDQKQGMHKEMENTSEEYTRITQTGDT